jgi:hypothetical protein
MRWFSSPSHDDLEQAAQTFDSDVHTASHPYCDDLACWCHVSVPYHRQVMQPLDQQGQTDERVSQAFSFFGLLR